MYLINFEKYSFLGEKYIYQRPKILRYIYQGGVTPKNNTDSGRISLFEIPSRPDFGRFVFFGNYALEGVTTY